MEIIIKRDIFLAFKGTPPIPTPNYGITLNWTNKVVTGTGVNRGWILFKKQITCNTKE